MKIIPGHEYLLWKGESRARVRVIAILGYNCCEIIMIDNMGNHELAWRNGHTYSTYGSSLLPLSDPNNILKDLLNS